MFPEILISKCLIIQKNHKKHTVWICSFSLVLFWCFYRWNAPHIYLQLLCIPLWIVGCVCLMCYPLPWWKVKTNSFCTAVFLRGSLKSPWSRRRKKHALLPKQWKSFFTPEGKLTDGGVKFLKKVRSGVCCWLFTCLFSLFSVYIAFLYSLT